MAKIARKVSLINVHDYSRDKYSAYYEIRVLAGGKDESETEEGFVWGVRVYSRKEFERVPVMGEDGKQAKVDVEDPNNPGMPLLGEDGKPIKALAFTRMCKILEEATGAVTQTDIAGRLTMDQVALTQAMRDLADTQAQTWVQQNMEKYRLPKTASSSPSGYVIPIPVDLLGQVVREALDGLRSFWDRISGPLFAIAYSTTVRHNRLHAVRDAIDGGAGAGLLRIYDGSRPATCGTATTLLAELTFSDPCAGSASAGVLTMNAITADASANATGTATWFRCVDSTGTCVIDGNCATSASDLNLNSTSINTGVQVSVTSFTLTAGNP